MASNGWGIVFLADIDFRNSFQIDGVLLIVCQHVDSELFCDSLVPSVSHIEFVCKNIVGAFANSPVFHEGGEFRLG